jgi:hypothetical protein
MHKDYFKFIDAHYYLGPVCLGCLWLAVQGKLLSRESCCMEKAAVLTFTVWRLDWLSSCMMNIV